MMTKAIWTRVADITLIIKSLITDNCQLDVQLYHCHSAYLDVWNFHCVLLLFKSCKYLHFAPHYNNISIEI